MYEDQDLHKAEMLIESGYIQDIDVIELAKRLYDKRTKHIRTKGD